MDLKGAEGVSLDCENWTVFKDAFAPQPTKAPPKPWERAPVSATAPRLAGTKIFKRTRSHNQLRGDEKENEELAQVELQKAGAGMRKRARVLGEKRSGNIANASWKAKDASPQKNFLAGSLLKFSPQKKSLDLSPAKRTARKRTNTDHVITPRKTHKKALLNVVHESNAVDIEEKPRRRKSLRKSTRLLLLPTLEHEQKRESLADMRIFTGGNNHVQLQPETSLFHTHPERMSRETTPAINPIEEDAPAQEPKEVDSNELSKAVILSPPDSMDWMKPSALRVMEESFVFEDTLLGDEAAAWTSPSLELSEANSEESFKHDSAPGQSDTETTGEFIISGNHQLEDSGEDREQILAPKADPVNISSPQLDLSEEALLEEIKEGQTVMESMKSSPQPWTESGNSILDRNASQLDGSSASINLSNQLQMSCEQEPTILENTKGDVHDSVITHSKIPVTPKTRKRTPQRSGTRKSTRTTRASSAHLTDQAPQETTSIESLQASCSRRSSSRRKSSPSKTPRRPTASKELNSLPVEHSTASEETEGLIATPQNQTISAMITSGGKIPLLHEGSNSVDTPNILAVIFQSPKQNKDDKDDKDAYMENNTSTSEVDPTVLGEILETTSSDLDANSNEFHIRHIDTEADGCNFLPDTLIKSTAQTIQDFEPVLDSIEDGREAPSVASVLDRGNTSVNADTPEAEPVAGCATDASSSDSTGASSIASPILDDSVVDAPEDFEPITPTIPGHESEGTPENTEELQETSTPDPTTTALVQAISENAPATTYDHDDTDMLRNFLTRVKANKAAKAEEKAAPKRKRSLPHSPLQIPLGTDSHTNLSPKDRDESDLNPTTEPPAKRRKRNEPAEEEPRSIRRSGRTRLPVKTPIAAPSFIPVRRLGQEGGDNTITVRRTEDKELAALTRVNTRKNKGGALNPLDFLSKKAEERDDPAARQKALKEVFDEKEKRKGKKRKTVVWAEELALYQGPDGKEIAMTTKQVQVEVAEPEKAKESVEEKVKKRSVPKVGVRSQIALGMAANGTPAPKRKKGRT